MKRPLCILTVYLVAGILCGQYISFIELVASIFISVVLFSTLIYFRTKTPEIFFGVIFFVIGFLLLQNSLLQNNHLYDYNHNKQINLTGFLTDISVTQTGGMKAVMHVTSPEKFKTVAYFSEYYSFDSTELISVLASLQEPALPTNPGGFNQYIYYKTRGLSYTLFVEEFYNTNTKIYTPSTLLQKVRNRLAHVYDSILPAEDASVIKAMVLGYNSSLDQEISELYKKAGISHVIAISGTHLTLIAFIIYKCCIAVSMSKRKAAVITIAFLALYTFFVGMPASGVRALLMAACILSAVLVRKRADIFNAIGLSALIQLLFQPLLLWDIGFQLSYAAVIGILIFAQMTDRLVFIPRFIRNIFAPTIGASLATLPIVLYHFYFVSVISIIVNIVILPFASLVLIAALVAGIVGLFSVGAGLYFVGVVYFILRFFILCCRFFIGIPFSILPLGQPNLFLVVLFYIFFGIIYCCVFSKFYLMKRVIIFVLTTAIFIFANITVMQREKDFEITFLDVSQGDSAVITTPDKKAFLIDGGGSRYRFERGLSSEGEYSVYPFLQYNGISMLDAVFITHFDSDHAVGVLEVLSHIPAKVIYIPPSIPKNENSEASILYNLLLQLANDNKIPVEILTEKMSLDLAEGLALTCLSPPSDGFSSTNDSSLVMKISYNNATFLFTGDIEKNAEDRLLKNYLEEIDVDVLKVAHHGSKTSSSKEFIDAVSPSASIISCSKNNSYGHPHEDVLENLSPSKIWITSENGAIVCNVKNNEVIVRGILDEEKSKYEGFKR